MPVATRSTGRVSRAMPSRACSSRVTTCRTRWGPWKVSKRVRVTARVRAAEVATVDVRGKVRIRGGKSYTLARRTVPLAAGSVRQLKVRLAKGDRKVLKAVQRFRNGKGRKVRARLDLVVTTEAGARSARKVVVQLR